MKLVVALDQKNRPHCAECIRKLKPRGIPKTWLPVYDTDSWLVEIEPDCVDCGEGWMGP